MALFDLKDQAVIVGVGTSQEFGFDLGKSPITLEIEAFKAALQDAGIDRKDVDGFNTAHGAPSGVDYDEFAVQAGCRFRWVNQYWTHGRWAATSVADSALAVCAGLCDFVAICNTAVSGRGYGRYVRRHGGGSGETLRDIGGGHGEAPIAGLDTPGAATAMVAKKYMDKYGATSEELGAVAVAFRKHACLNPMAIGYGKPLTLEDYLNSRPIVLPFRRYDYSLFTEGSTCLIVTTPEKAQRLAKRPVYISGVQGIPVSRNDFALFARPGLGISFEEEFDYQPEDHPANKMAGVGPKDIDAFYTYDAFSSNAWMALERFGFCKPGEAHTWAVGGRIELGGELPMNTNGGILSEGDYNGYAHLVEMVRQLRGEAGPRQVAGAKVLQWGTPWGDSVILTRR